MNSPVLPDNSPLSLKIHLLKLLCREKNSDRISADFANECKKIIAKYKKQAAGKLWRHYIAVCQQLLNHYSELHNTPAFNAVLFEVLENEPRYLPFLAYFFINANFKDIPLKKVNSIIEKYEKSDARKYPNVDYLKLKILEKTNSNTFNLAYNFLTKHPHFELLKDVVNLFEKSLDRTNSVQVKKYKNALKILAVKQPVKKTETISFIINKINKK